MAPVNLKEAKARLKIPDLWGFLNLPGDCSENPCHSPFYERTSKPSFSVSEGGDLFNDFRTGEKGDAVTFLQLVIGISQKEACRKFLELAGERASSPLPVIPRAAMPPQARELPVLPTMRSGTPEEHETLAKLRCVHVEAVKMADSVGLLRFGNWKGQAAWFVREPGGRVAQARQLNGKLWEGINAKAQTLPGCWANWPIGAGFGEYQTICFVEGGPDLLAAFHFIILEGRAAEIAPVAMLGAGQKIHPHALHLFAGKRVRIYAHGDAPGREAARRWKEQLESVGCLVDAVDCGGYRMQDGRTSNDLNDLTQIHPDDAGEITDLLPE